MSLMEFNLNPQIDLDFCAHANSHFYPEKCIAQAFTFTINLHLNFRCVTKINLSPMFDRLGETMNKEQKKRIIN